MRENNDVVLLGKRIAAERSRRSWSKSDLARRAGISPSYITRIEAGAYASPSIDHVRAIADALRIDLAALTDPPPPEDRADELLLKRLLARKLHGSQRAAEILAAAIDAATVEPASDGRTLLNVVQVLLPTLPLSDDD